MRILLVDSDLESLRNIADHIKSTTKNVDIKQQTINTIGFLRMINEYSPEIVFLNIRFFGLESIKIIRDVREFHPSVKLIIFGTYSDNEYIQKAMDYGIFDYIYKPIKLSEITRCIKKAVELLKEEEEQNARKNRLLKEYKTKIKHFEHVFITTLIKGRISDDNEIYSSFNYFKMDLKPDFTVFVLRIDHYKTILLTLEDREKHLLIYEIYQIMRSVLKDKKFILHINKFNSITGILANTSDFAQIMQLCTEIKDEVYNRLNIRITMGIGRTYQSPSQIALSYREAIACLRYRFYMGYNSVIPIQFTEPNNKLTYSYPLEKEKLLVYTAVIGEYDACIVFLKDIIHSLRLCEPLPDKLLPKIILDILISINRYASELNLNVENRFTTFFSSKEALELKDLDSAYEYMAGALKNFCEYIITLRNEADKILLDKCKDLMEQTYTENFSLSALAMALDTTAEYLERVFLIDQGKTPHDYMHTLRLEEAKKLMRQTRFDDLLIALQVGYSDVKHYKSMFRKYEGITAHEYRTKYSVYSEDFEEI